jgi:hypothetical protein
VGECARQHGCSVELTGGHHLRLRHPSGWFVICPQTPSETRRALQNLRAELKRQSKKAA